MFRIFFLKEKVDSFVKFFGVILLGGSDIERRGGLVLYRVCLGISREGVVLGFVCGVVWVGS